MAVLLSSCFSSAAFDPPATHPSHRAASAAISADSSDTGKRLARLWTVTGVKGEGRDTWLWLGPGEFMYWGSCGRVMGSWAAAEGAFVVLDFGTGLHYCDSANFVDQPAWLHAVRGYHFDGENAVLTTARGAIAATLVPGGDPPKSAYYAHFYRVDPDLSPEDVTRYFPAPAALPERAVPGRIVGRWVSPKVGSETPRPYVQFWPDGTWNGVEGCDPTSGNWRSLTDGRLLVAGGVSGLNLCTGDWGGETTGLLWRATRVGLVDGRLTFFDVKGREIGQLIRDLRTEPATRQDLIGRWIPKVATPSAFMTLTADGRWNSSHACNSGTGGRWKVGENGAFAASGGSTTFMACLDNSSDLSPIPGHTVRAMLAGDTLLMYDRDGATLGVFVRG